MVDPHGPVLPYADRNISGRRGAKAIIAFTLALVGILIFPLPLVAFVLAGEALRDKKQIDVRGYRLARSARIISPFTCILSLLVAWSVIFPEPRSRPAAKRIICGSNMRQIGLGLKMYASENHDCYPPDLSTLLHNAELTAELFICPDSTDVVDRAATQPNDSVVPGTAHCSYIYFPDPALRDSTVSPDRIMLIEPLSNHDGEGMNVLYADDHVDWMDKAEASRVMAQLLIGHNPPWPPTSQPAVAAAATQP